MALSKPNADFFGFTTEIYVKIHQTLVSEVGEDEEGKIYQVKLGCNWYTNPDKAHQFSQTEEILENIRETELALPTLYEKMKGLEKFAEFQDA